MYGAGYTPTPEQQAQIEAARKQRIKDKHDEILEEQPNGGKGGPDRSQIDTQFMSLGIPALKKMIEDSDPDRIYEASQHWKQVHNILSGGDGDGKSGGVDQVSAKDSIAGRLQTAVENVLEHWQGEAAQAFAREAGKIQAKVQNGSAWANFTAENMDRTQKDLRASKEKMRDIKEPGAWDRAWDKAFDDERSDKQLLEDIKNGASTEAAAKANADSLSLGKQRQLEAVAVMEQLAVNYKAYSKGAPPVNERDPYSPPSNDVTMPPPISMPAPSGATPGAAGSVPKPWSAGNANNITNQPQVPRPKGITGGAQLPPATGTNVDSIKPGLTGPGTSGPSGIGGPSGGGGLGNPSGPGVIPAGGGPGIGPGGGSRGVGTPGGRSGGIGGPGAAGANRGTGGRPGMGGMGGGAGAGGAGRGGAGAGGRGALAKARGGVVGAAKGIAGKGAGTGSGLHGSRGGSQRGGMMGGAGGMGGRGSGRRGEEENGGERPDYLVEDEETWISEEDRNRNVPRNIE
ncbi:hypothetical protein P8605_02035 [Streptomyces sp. T-3]|nr:hypothetical protein [Streptomyces sp. T-3]